MGLLNSLKTRIPKGTLTAVLVIVILVQMFFLFQHTSVERTEKKETRTQVTTTQVTNEDTKVAQDEKTTYGSFDTGKQAHSYNSTSGRATRTTTKKKTTQYDPVSKQPAVVIEEETTTDDNYNRQANSRTETETTSRQVQTTQTQTTAQTTASTTTTQTVEDTTKTETVVRAGDVGGNSPLGVGVTSEKRIAITYDIVKRGRFSLTGMVEADPKQAEISGGGLGINADIAKNGRYFAGVYGKYDLQDKDTGVVGMVGMRF